MDQAKTLRLKSRQRIASLPDALGELGNPFEKLAHSSSSPKLPKHLLESRRHTIHVPYSGSPVQDITDDFKLLINPRSESRGEARGEGSTNGETDNEMNARHAHLPTLQGTRLTLEPSADKKINKRLQRFHLHDDGDEMKGSFQAWTWVKNGANHASPFGLGAKSTFPEITKSTLQDNRRHSLPVSTDNMADLFSTSFSTTNRNFGTGCVAHSKAEKTNSLPQVTHAKLINLKINQPEKHRFDETEYQRKLPSTDVSHHCFSANQTMSCAEDKTKYPYGNEKVQAMRTYVEKAEAEFDREETRAVRSLNDAEIALLQKGVNFSVTPANIPAKQIIASVESAVRQLNVERADTVRRTVKNILQQAEPPEPNITKEMRDTLKRLKEDESIMVLPEDKGRASVVMDADTYRTKISTLIDTGPYQRLNRDPTDRLTRELSEKLLTLKRNVDLSEAV
ncbi:hypothetical protein ACROYT_G017502 [Oculina patagonica]